MKGKNRRLTAACICFFVLCLVAGGIAGWYFGMYTKDFKVTKGEVFSEVYEGDFYENLPFDAYLQAVDLPVNTYIVDIRNCGARTDAENNRDAIQTAIEEAAAHGGTVYVSGGEYITGSLTLKSNVTLFIDKDSALVASRKAADMDKGCLLLAENAENIVLTGGGKLCGEGNYYSLAPKEAPKTEPFEQALGVWEMRQEYRYRVRFAHESKYGNLIRFCDCRGVTIENFMLENSAAWTLELNGCDGVQIRDLVINNNRHVANTDGIDVAGSSDVTIEHCFISTGDDGIVLKNSKSLGNCKKMENVTVRDCKVTSCTNAFKIGTETSYDISGVTVENCEFFLEDIYPGGVSGISIESADGAKVENVEIRNIQMRGETCPLFISLNNRNRDKDFDNVGAIQNVKVENLTADGVELPVIITGTKDLTVQDITLNNVHLQYAPGVDYYDYRPFVPAYDDTYPECNRMRNLNAYGLYGRYADNVKLTDFTVVPRENTKRTEMLLKECTVLRDETV
ncbi:MAG: glycoside hydrolase family 28 protein [Candidatus Fimenecus sp.]